MRTLAHAVIVATLGIACQNGAQPLTVAPFDDTFLWEHSGACTGQRAEGQTLVDPKIRGYAPTTRGVRYPLFIYSVGTFDTFDNPVVNAILREVATRGFVAVSAQYENGLLYACTQLEQKAKCLYDSNEPSSVAAKTCARPDVDCDSGIVVMGHSQGSEVSMRAKNWNPSVLAAVGLGATCDAFVSFGTGDNPGLCSPNTPNDDTCLLDSNTALPGDRVRLVSGETDVFGAQGEYERQTGRVCAPGTTSCLADNGSGWIVVGNSEVQDGDADHSFFVNNGSSVLDTGFAPPSTHPWSLDTLIDWLKGFTA